MLSSEAKASAYIIGSLPFIMALLIYLINPGYISELWIDPRGKRRERSRVDFDAGDGAARAWSWLRLRPREDSALERHLFGDVTAGYTEFVGDWSARVYLDGSLIGKERFRIAC